MGELRKTARQPGTGHYLDGSLDATMEHIHTISPHPLSVKANRPLDLGDLIEGAQARDDEVRGWLSTLTSYFPKDSTLNVRALGRWAANGYYRVPADLDLAADHIIAIDDLGIFYGVYCTLNPCAPALAARGPFEISGDRVWGPKEGAGDSDILRREWIMLDFDPKRPTGISSTDEEHAAALALAVQVHDILHDKFGFDHAMVASSGNGGHWLHPFEAENTEKVTQMLREFLASAARLVAEIAPGANVTVDQAVFNAARIWRVYGTTARKGISMPDRPHRTSRILTPEEMSAVRGGSIRD